MPMACMPDIVLFRSAPVGMMLPAPSAARVGEARMVAKAVIAGGFDHDKYPGAV